MQEPIYIKGIYRCFCNTISIFNDINDTIDMRKIYPDQLSWAVTEYGRIQFIIKDCTGNKRVIAEYEGNGWVHIHVCDEYGKPYDFPEGFSFCTIPYNNPRDEFENLLKNTFNLTLYKD